jgi:hypothetical protein
MGPYSGCIIKKMLRKGLKEIFTQELTPSEKFFFLKKAREAITQKRYPAGEALFHYCYFLTLKERMRGISSLGSEGFMRFLLVEGKKNIEEAVTLYQERLDKRKVPPADSTGYKFIKYFSE